VPWYKQPSVLRFVGGAVGVSIAASCSLWPVKVQPVCKALSGFIHGYNPAPVKTLSESQENKEEM